MDLNPLRAGMARNALEYAWSSAKAHAVGVETDALVDGWAWSELRIARNWNEILEAGNSIRFGGCRVRRGNGEASGAQTTARASGTKAKRRKGGRWSRNFGGEA